MSIPAQYDGKCAACDEPIEEGDPITNDDGYWVHALCVVSGSEPARQACPDCHIEHAGECA